MNRRTFFKSCAAAIGIAPFVADAVSTSETLTSPLKAIQPGTVIGHCSYEGKIVPPNMYLHPWINKVLCLGGSLSFGWEDFERGMIMPGTIEITGMPIGTVRDDGNGNLFVSQPNDLTGTSIQVGVW